MKSGNLYLARGEVVGRGVVDRVYSLICEGFGGVDDLLFHGFRSVAYLCLSHSARLILLDWVGRYEEATGYETDIRLADKGLTYPFRECTEPVSRATFYRAVDELISKGFLEKHPKFQHTTGEHMRYRPSHQWLAYEPTDAELGILAAYQDRRAPDYTGQMHLHHDAIEYTEGIDPGRALEVTGSPNLSRAAYRRRARSERKAQR